MSTPTTTPDLQALVAAMQEKIAQLEAQAAVTNGTAPAPTAEEIAGAQSGSAEALAFVEAVATAVSAQTYENSLVVSDALKALLAVVTR